MKREKFPNAAAARRAIRKRAQEEGALVAYEACLEIAKDKTAASQARANAANTVLRIGGFFEPSSNDDIDDKPASAMTREEIDLRIRELEAERSPLINHDHAEDEKDDDGTPSAFS